MNTGTAKGVCSWLTSWPRKRVNIVGCLTWINMWIKIGFGKQKKAALRRTVSTTTKTSSMLESWRNATWSQICYLLNIDWHLGYPQFWLICSFSAYWINGPPLTIRSAPNLWSLQTLLFFRFHFCGSSWVRSGGGLGYLQSKFVGQNCTYKLSTVNLNDASFGACNHFSSLRDSVIKKSMCRQGEDGPVFNKVWHRNYPPSHQTDATVQTSPVTPRVSRRCNLQTGPVIRRVFFAQSSPRNRFRAVVTLGLIWASAHYSLPWVGCQNTRWKHHLNSDTCNEISPFGKAERQFPYQWYGWI